MPDDTSAEIDKLQQQIVELQKRLEEATDTSQSGSGAVATTGGAAAGKGGAAIRGNVDGPVVVAGAGATVVFGDQPIRMTAVRCAFRGGHEPYFRRRDFGFRVVVRPAF